MKKFREQFPEYMSFTNDNYIMNEIPYSYIGSIQNIFIKGAQLKIKNYSGPGRLVNDSVMQVLVNKVAEYSFVERTKNWGWDFLVHDLKENMESLYKVPFHRFMDAISDISLNFLEGAIIDDLNELFEYTNFGYRITNSDEGPWSSINPKIGMSVKIEDVVDLTLKICKQTTDHIEQAKEQLKRADNPRARKDAIRDCLSAMEALMKRITKTKDIVEANNYLVSHTETWGPKVIVTDGHKLWKLFHNDYKDIRHGDIDISSITQEESMYFIDRILSYVTYLSKLALKDHRQ